MASRPKGRPEFWGVVVTRAPDHLESWGIWIRGKRGLSFLLATLAILGIGVLNVAEWIDLSWLWFVVALLLLAFVLFHETTYEIWKELESLRDEQRHSGVYVDPTGVMTLSRNTPGRVAISTSVNDGEAQSVVVSEDDPTPRAIRLLAPRETDYIRPEHLPRRVRWHRYWRRYSIEIVSFVPGGIVLDGTNGPPLAPLKVMIYFESPARIEEELEV